MVYIIRVPIAFRRHTWDYVKERTLWESELDPKGYPDYSNTLRKSHILRTTDTLNRGKRTLMKFFLSTLLLSTAMVIACGGVADSPDGAVSPPVSPAAVAGEIDQTPVQQNLATESNQPETASAIPPAPQPGVDDGRADALVAEWEADLAPINLLAECIQQELGLGRPLLPEDLALQANQPAIVSCVKREVGNE